MAKSRLNMNIANKKIEVRNKQKVEKVEIEESTAKPEQKRPTKVTKKGRKPFTTMLQGDFKKRLKQAALNSDGEFTVADLIEKYIVEGLKRDKF